MSKPNPRSVGRTGAKDEAPDFELVFTASGEVELIDTQDDEVVWCSTDDDDFIEEFDDYLDGEDSENILSYLHDNEYIDSTEDIIDIVEEDAEDSLLESTDKDGVMEGEYIPAPSRTGTRNPGRKT